MFNLPHFYVQAQIQDWGPDCMVNGVPTLKCLEFVFGNLIFISSAIVMLVLFIMFIVGSFEYLTSFGNPEKVKKAQGTLKFALLGFFLFISAYLIIRLLDVLFLGGLGNLLKFNIPG